MRYRDALIGLVVGVVLALLIYSRAPNIETWIILPSAGLVGGHMGGGPGRRRQRQGWAIAGAILGAISLGIVLMVIYLMVALFIFGFGP